ncbi:MAG: Abortive infection protein AbiEi [Bacteroidetes bacterium]|jgi:predicted transcriptional regulator of viral defense system|nr:Abortive infection protein AbiEi [Bacteroidota bacterium]
MEKIVEYIKDKGGYARQTELREHGFQSRDITKLFQESVLEKVQPGLYKLAESDISSGFVDVSKAIPNGVIALASALEYYELTTFNPSKVHLAIPNDAKPPKVHFPPVEIYYFRETQYSTGIQEITIQGHQVKMYNKEKIVCDMFRYRNKLGEDLAFEGLRNYLRLPEANLNEIQKYMEICRVKTVMKPYLKALVSGWAAD